MLESSSSRPAQNYSYIVHTPKGCTFLAPQLNYITDIILELKAELTNFKVELKEIKKQLLVTHLFFINEIRHNRKSFKYLYPFST